MRLIIEFENVEYISKVIEEIKKGYSSGLIDSENNWELERFKDE